MSRTELYVVKKDGELYLYHEFGNALRGAYLLWDNLCKKYLYRTASYYTFHENEERELWDLDINQKIPRCLRLLFASTFDYMMIKKENLPKFIDAIQESIENGYFSDLGHFKKYPEVFKEILQDEDVIAIAWNQTSVCCDVWDVYEDCPTCGESSIRRGYNIFKDTKHIFLFEYLENREKK